MWNRIKAMWQSFGRFIAVIAGALLLLAVGNVPAIMNTIIWLLAFGLVNYGLRGKGIVQLIGNVVVLVCLIASPGVRGYFTKQLPLTSKTLEVVPTKIDVGIAQRTFSPGVEAEAKNMEARLVIDSGFTSEYKIKVDMLLESARVGLISWDSALAFLNDSLVLGLSKYQAEQLQKEFKDARSKSEHSVALDSVVYDVRNHGIMVATVPPHSRLVIMSHTSGYICDPKVGQVKTPDGLGYLAPAFNDSEFIAPGRPIFCLVADMGTQVVPFLNGSATLYNETDYELNARVRLNERQCDNCYDDNAGGVTLYPKIIPFSI